MFYNEQVTCQSMCVVGGRLLVIRRILKLSNTKFDPADIVICILFFNILTVRDVLDDFYYLVNKFFNAH